MLRVLVLVFGVFSVSAAYAQQLLETITVSGTSVEIPWGGGGGGGGGGGVNGHFKNTTTLSSCNGPDAGCALDLTPAQGGFVEFSLPVRGIYPFITHRFVDAAKGASGQFIAGNVPPGQAG